MKPMQAPIRVMTDCHSLGFVMSCQLVTSQLPQGSGAEAPIFALKMLMRALGKSDLIQHVFSSRNGIIQTAFCWEGFSLLPRFLWARSSCDKAAGPQAFIKSNFPHVKCGPYGILIPISCLSGFLWDDQGSIRTSLAETSLLT